MTRDAASTASASTARVVAGRAPQPAAALRRRAQGALWWIARLLRPRHRLRQVSRAWRRRVRPLHPAPAWQVLFPLAAHEPNGGWTFRDETWVRVERRGEHRRLLQEGRALTVVDNAQTPGDEVRCGPDGSVVADLTARTPQAWAWLYLDPARHSWRNFRWEFTAQRDSEFRELQFGFRYLDFYNRYRFRHEDDHLHFDIAVNGAFRNSLHQVPFRMTLGRPYRFAIETRGSRFTLTVDGQVMLDEVDRDELFPRGSIAVIFWESDGRTPIKAAVTAMRVVETPP